MGHLTETKTTKKADHGNQQSKRWDQVFRYLWTINMIERAPPEVSWVNHQLCFREKGLPDQVGNPFIYHVVCLRFLSEVSLDN